MIDVGDTRWMDDRRVGLIIRALRRRRGWRQVDLAAAAGVSQAAISVVERGHVDTMSLRTTRQILLALEIRGELDLRWRGGSLDRTLDDRHAALSGVAVGVLARFGWESAVEVTYAIYGERGSIDVLAFHRSTGSLLVIEVKTELTSVEGMLRRLDEKVRLASRIARERLDWIATSTSRLLVLPDSAAARRSSSRYGDVLDAVLPAGNVTIRHWLEDPARPLAGRWFLADNSPGSAGRTPGGPARVTRPTASSNRARPSTTRVNSVMPGPVNRRRND